MVVLKFFVRKKIYIYIPFLSGYIRNNFASVRKTNINNVFSDVNAKVIKIPLTCKLEMCNVFFISSSVIQGGLLFLLFNNKLSRAGNYYPFIFGLIVTLTFIHKEWKKNQSKPANQCFYFVEKQRFFFHKGDQKKNEKEKKRNHSKQMFCDSHCILFTVTVVIIQLYVVSPVSSCLCILRVSFCLFLLWLF